MRGATEGGTQPKEAMFSCTECGAAIGGLTRARGQAARERSKKSAREGGAVAKERDYFCAAGGTAIGAR
jgi:ribosomal protein L34E